MKGSYVYADLRQRLYGGNTNHDNSQRLLDIGISEPAGRGDEQYYPVLFKRALRDGSGGAGERRGGLGLHYEVELLRGEARASFVMDHGRFGPPGVLGEAATKRQW